MIQLITAVALTVWVPAKPLVPAVSCPASLQIGTSVNGRDDRSDQIGARRALWAHFGATNTLVGYEYQTFGGKEFVQFSNAFTTSLFPYEGSVFAALTLAIRVTKVPRRALPLPLRKLEAGTPIFAGVCTRPVAKRTP